MATSTDTLVDYRIRGIGAGAEFVYAPELLDEELASASEGVDLVTAGPPCQGHSNLNDRSRRNDRRNLLYLTVPAFAVACRARSVAIENVASVVHDTSSVVVTTRALLAANGYIVTDGVLAADERPRSVAWALGDRQGLSLDAAMHVLPEYTEANRERIAWLFDNGEHDLALAERPECHQEGTSYGAVYGRMHADRPAPTITLRAKVADNGGSTMLPDAIPLLCEPGDATVVNRHMVHGSYANTSADPRISVTFGFHRRSSVVGVAGQLRVHERDNVVVYDSERVFKRSSVIAVAIDARAQHRPGERRYTYAPFVGLEDDFRFSDEMFDRVIRDYNLNDLAI